MAINIFQEKDTDSERNEQLKKTWRQWKSINMDSHSIFFPIFKEFAEQYLKDISGGACKLYIFLGSVAKSSGESWYSVKRMAEQLGVSQRTIDNYLKELEDFGLIVRERSNSSSTTYLCPYSLNLYTVKPTTERTLENILQTAILEAKFKEFVVGVIYRVFHLFQWADEAQTKCIQGVAVTTKKTYPKGTHQFSAFAYVDYFNNHEFVINTPHISGVRRFSSNLQLTDSEVMGIALDIDDKLITVTNLRSALAQLCKAPIEHIQDFQSVDFIRANRQEPG